MAENSGESRQRAIAVQSAYDALAPGYDTTYSDEVSRAEDRRLMRALRPEIERAKSILDVGCGTGWVLDQAPDVIRRREYWGFDLSEGMLKQLRSKHTWLPEERVWQGDVNGAWSAGRPDFDLLVSTYASPSYAADTQEFLLQCRHALRAGGRAVLVPHATGNTLRAPYLTDQPAAYIGDQPWYEHRARRELLAAGFVDVQVTGMRHPLFGPNETRGRRVHDAWMRVEERLFRPDSMSFLVVTATAR